MTLAEALVYQREQDEAKRPFYGNPNLAAQGRNANIAERSRAFPFMQAADAQFQKEKSSLSDRGAITDLINKGFIAGLGGAPVDIINMGLTPLGMGSAFPFGGSEHIKRVMEDYGVATPTERPMLETLTSLTPPRAVMGAARVAGQGAEAVGRAAAPVAGQALENYMVRTGGILPMDTWHGSPHRFPPTKNNPLGEFDPMKIGTGEGAQTYGVGAGYLAEVKDLAKGYKDRLSGNKTLAGVKHNVFIDGKPLSEFDLSPTLTSYVENHGSIDGAIKQLSKTVSDYEGWAKTAATPKQAQDYLSVAESWKPSIDKLKSVVGKVTSSPRSSGFLYKVDLPDEQIAKMLDWDKPISRQSEEVKAVIRKIGGMSGTDVQGWYGWRAKVLGSERAASDELRAAGIPGIRYLDQGSRSGGAGTSNFVVFDPKHMNIIGRE